MSRPNSETAPLLPGMESFTVSHWLAHHKVSRRAIVAQRFPFICHICFISQVHGFAAPLPGVVTLRQCPIGVSLICIDDLIGPKVLCQLSLRCLSLSWRWIRYCLHR